MAPAATDRQFLPIGRSAANDAAVDRRDRRTDRHPTVRYTDTVPHSTRAQRQDNYTTRIQLCRRDGDNNNNNNNNNSHDNVYGAVIMTQSHCESSLGTSDECRLSAGWPPTLRPSQSTWAVSPPKIGSYHPHPPSPLLLLLSP